MPKRKSTTIEQAMLRMTGGCIGTLHLLQMAPDGFVQEALRLAEEAAEARRENRVDEVVEAHLPCGTLIVRQDAMPGATAHLQISPGVSYQMSTLWLSATVLPQTMLAAMVGRRVAEIVEIAESLPRIIAEAVVVDAMNTGGIRRPIAERDVRLELGVPTWRPDGWQTA